MRRRGSCIYICSCLVFSALSVISGRKGPEKTEQLHIYMQLLESGESVRKASKRSPASGLTRFRLGKERQSGGTEETQFGGSCPSCVVSRLSG